MTPLLEALQAAAKVGFDAPKCRSCGGLKTHHEHYPPEPPAFLEYSEDTGAPCPACHATGLDASDPERLIGRAMMRLRERQEHVLAPWDTDEVETVGINPENCMEYYGHDREALPERSEPHDGTPTGIAAALLRLVARVGAARPTPEKCQTETA